MDIQKTIDNLKKRGFAVQFFETGAEASAYLKQSLTGKTIGIGGSKTVSELGLYEVLTETNEVHWHMPNPGMETIRKANASPVYISGANAIAETGEIINIDGRGNRVAATLFEREVVYIISGVNKIAPSFDEAMERARNIAAPPNAKRLNMRTPCAADGKCHDCSSPDRICNAAVVLWGRPLGVGKIEVILINETLGY